MKRKKILVIVGTRPNFIKVTQFKKQALKFPSLEIILVHTGQHYDEKMADVFFRQFDLAPDHYLNIKTATPEEQVKEIITKLGELIGRIGKPDILLVPGDVNSTLAGARFAHQHKIKLGHIEAGLRSFDNSMPEEYNRIVADELSDFYFVTEPSGVKHLKSDGRDEKAIHYVGNTMIDTMVAFEKEINASPILEELGLVEKKFVLMTMHRPATVDNKSEFEKMIALIAELVKKYKVVFPIHPRTIKNAREFGLHEKLASNKDLICTEPLDYFSFHKLIKHCSFIVTDSGGIQEESTFRQIPCLTLRPNTERPVTVDEGTNTLLPFDTEKVKSLVSQIENGAYKKGRVPHLWDGKATERILKTLAEI